MKTMYKITMLCFILFFLFKIDVYAEKISCKDKTNVNYKGEYGLYLDDDEEHTYKIKMLSLDELQKDEVTKEEIKDLVFTVTAINGSNSSSVNSELIGKTITFGGEIKGIVGEFDDNETMKIDFESTVEDADPNCNGTVYAYVSVFEPSGSSNLSDVTSTFTNLPKLNNDGKQLLSYSCANGNENKLNPVQAAAIDTEKYGYNTFEGRFCGMFDMAIMNGLTTDFSQKTLKCDYEKYKVKDDDYYVNASYFYGKTSSEVVGGTYYKHLDFARPAVEAGTAVCTKECEEVVKVEYGPPASSLGGVCFEYKVRVTSLVNCVTSNVTPPPEPSEYKVCTPKPRCWHAGVTYLQGGPSEDFDACIKKCDGGKYTEKCSKSCYNSVYNATSNNKMSSLFDLTYANKMISSNEISQIDINGPDSKFNFESCASYVNVDPNANDGQGVFEDNNDGCYYYDTSDGVIKWASKPVSRKGKTRGLIHRLDSGYHDHTVRAISGHENDTIRVLDSNYGGEWHSAGRWYIYNWHKSYHDGLGYDVSGTDGFYRANYGGYHCGDWCEWINCNSSQYLNFGFAEKDMAANYDTYMIAYSSCAAAASCSETTAEVTMSVDYKVMKEGHEVNQSVHFPYYESKDEATGITTVFNKKDYMNSVGVKSVQNSNTIGSTNPKSTIIKDTNFGCYKDDTNPSLYQFSISFPGTWQANKGGFVYANPHNNEEYIYHENEFCLPESSLDVNQNWDHYVTAIEKRDAGTLDEDFNTPPYKQCSSNCKGKYTGCELPLSDVGNMLWNEFGEKFGSSIEYNIHSYINNFGYLGWNFNVDCFYAQSHDTECSKTSDELTNACEPCITDDPDTSYTIRTVDLKCLFPSTTDSCSNYDNTILTTDRIHGYNWSDFAILKKEAGQTNQYTSTPSYIVEQIQNKGYTIYDDINQLDYEFKITPQLIKKVKNSDYKYGSFAGSYLNDMDATYKDYALQMYFSPAIRSGIFSDDSVAIHVPDSKLLICNNMYGAANGGSGICEPTSKEE